MPLHDDPICFSCLEKIDTRPLIFAAACDHDDCPSVVFHPLCLMDHRESHERHLRAKARFFETHRVTVEVEHLHDDEA